MNIRNDLIQPIQVCSVFSGAFMAWNLQFTINTSSPITVVISGSMEPAFQRGDIFSIQQKTKMKDLDLEIQNVVYCCITDIEKYQSFIEHQ